MDNTRQSRITAWERGGYSTPRAVTQRLVPNEAATCRLSPGDAQPDGSSSLSQSFSEVESRSNRRKNFWAKLRRPKSQDARVQEQVFAVPNNAAPPRRASAGEKLVWNAEQKLWMFGKNTGSSGGSNCGRHRGSSTEHAEEDLLFAQLPGHYALSSIYNCANYDQALPAYDPVRHVDDVGRRTSPDGQWMLVAATMIGQSASS
ncbi:hypothetical protein D8B26_003340 [Coccidioides posadasii str. Silveira]|uniref:Uncharacterized protein n=1 Tax=Coccidioides posadasii (strain RMSCC 757 / Silveira) TaxID=443226 RepID=E9CZY4_COCPS|nr:conserved hypothetical protein [Coccidioides posadasii str. Silveira]QVM08660.1 hypothetical protein D8B26_003340 [Coccidioides posadasii str. Silveira]